MSAITMLSTNVLCMKKKKKKSYCIGKSKNVLHATEKSQRSTGGVVNMLQITEDTPPDMLAGAMDLTVHLPTGRSVKMSVERSTPMMDLLVQITTNNQLQLSGFSLEALGMSPSGDYSDFILPYKPNTPIGALDTQHIRVIPKARAMPVPKNVPPGHQPFESTFRLRVHLPRNQLYVIRVSQNILLEDILKKVCQEKNLDLQKYELRHPGNLNESLDPKLTLRDYQITEIYIAARGATSPQTFSNSDIMALRKDEDRKQAHKTSGAVFNLIFRKGKSSTTGSLSSENRSISPTHSDDSRSVTPPGVQPLVDRPKPPQRKRRPAPKPPQEPARTEIKSLTICHSRNSSDSSGYHEASTLSDNFNASLPRRPKSTIINEDGKTQSNSNLNQMSSISKSTSSLTATNRKKKAPPPPPVLKPSFEATQEEPPSPVVASQSLVVEPTEIHGRGPDDVVSTNPTPTPTARTKILSPRPPIPVLEHSASTSNNEQSLPQPIPIPKRRKQLAPNLQGNEENNSRQGNTIENADIEKALELVDYSTQTSLIESVNPEIAEYVEAVPEYIEEISTSEIVDLESIRSENPDNIATQAQLETSTEAINPEVGRSESKETESLNMEAELASLQKQNVASIFSSDIFATPEVKPPEIVAFVPKAAKEHYPMFDSYSRKRGFHIGSSLLDLNDESRSSSNKNSIQSSDSNSISSALHAFDFVDEIDGVDMELFTGSFSKNSRKKNEVFNQLHGMHDYKSNPSGGSLRSTSSFPGFVTSNMKKWNNSDELDNVSIHSLGGGWVDGSDTESIASTLPTPFDSLASFQSVNTPEEAPKNPPVFKNSLPEGTVAEPPKPSSGDVQELPKPTVNEEQLPKFESLPHQDDQKENELEEDWQYQLPSPPKGFRDPSPVVFSTNTHEESVVDSVVTSPELFEKLKEVKDQSETSEVASTVQEEEKPIMSTLSLEHLEKRKSLVYNRVLATSLKMSEEKKSDSFATTLTKFEKTYEEVKSTVPKGSTLPNFKITTYDNPKQRMKVFEDDTIRSNGNFLEPTLLKNPYIGRSMENISFKRNSLDNSPEEESPGNYTFYKPANYKTQFGVNRSESFKKEPTWSPTKPVTRSVSHVALNKYKGTRRPSQEDDNLTKSNSLFDVSGLQSLGVMRLIQNKLNTPNNSTEELDCNENFQKPPEVKTEVQKPVEEKPIKTFSNQYRVPSINMSTWSERPKVPVNVKEDPDYKYGGKDNNNSKLIVNTVNNDIKSFNSIEVKNASLKSEISGQNTGNVLIKIGGPVVPPNKPVVMRRPLTSVNGSARPHSIAFGADCADISRVPFVRSVEFKKPYKEYHSNTSITPINNFQTSTLNRNGFKSSVEFSGNNKPQVEVKPVFRVNSYIQNSSAPVVRGFRNYPETNEKPWSQPHSFSTLPPKTSFVTNKSVPFTAANLRRTESTKVETSKNVIPAAPKMAGFKPPPPPQRTTSGDPKEQLLQAIRDFGGKKGLKAVKV